MDEDGAGLRRPSGPTARGVGAKGHSRRRGADRGSGHRPGAVPTCRRRGVATPNGARGRFRREVSQRGSVWGCTLPRAPHRGDPEPYGSSTWPARLLESIAEGLRVTERDRVPWPRPADAHSRTQSKATMSVFPAAWLREDSDSTAPQPPRGLMHSSRVHRERARGAAPSFASGWSVAPRCQSPARSHSFDPLVRTRRAATDGRGTGVERNG